MNQSNLVTKLVFGEEFPIPSQERYIFQFKHQGLPKLNPNQLNIAGVNLYKSNNGFVITTIIRSTIVKPVSFQDIRLLVKSKDGETIGKGTFEMSGFGTIQPNEAKPWRFTFLEENMTVALETIPDGMEYDIFFEIPTPAPLELIITSQANDTLTEEMKEKVLKTLQTKNALQNQLNLESIHVGIEDEHLSAYMLLTNASQKTINVQRIPLEIWDENSKLMTIEWRLENVEIPSRKSLLEKIVFPKQIEIDKSKKYTIKIKMQ